MAEPPASDWTERTARRRHREFWDAAHSAGWGDPTPSPLARWALPMIPEDGRGHRLLELGYGTGVDLPLFLERGYTVAGIELSRVAAGRGRAMTRDLDRPQGVPRPILDVGDALEFLETQPDSSATVVYANLFHSMGVPPSAEAERWSEIHRVLAPGGWHVYSVRTTTDKWFGVGRPLGPATFDPGEDGPPLRFFEPQEIGRIIHGRFEPMARQDGQEGEGEYRRTMLYAVDRKM